jgi:sterol desaturase/sphingolipid hydroxylase (fatty acid hydroxylase superfamily)
MGKFVSNRDETVRLFKNPVLEYFSHIHPATPLVVFIPVVAFLTYIGFTTVSWGAALATWLAGVLLWTLTEYSIHRWAFHYEPKTDTGKRIHFLVHGVHHDYPRDSTRLVMPLLVSVPLALAFYYLFKGMFGDYGYTVFAGFIAGYVAYDSIHYALHHFSMNGRMGKFMKNYHLRHHYNDEHTAYGISTPLWDMVFRTTPVHFNKRNEGESNPKSKSTNKTNDKPPVMENFLG